jgi:4-diphosphocytidyl-2-C-methyl-D-erythritol kinase
LRIAEEVGSDLPLFLVGGTVLGVGRGEHVYPLEDLPALPCVVITPDVGVSTPKAFAAWDRLGDSRMSDSMSDSMPDRVCNKLPGASAAAAKLTLSPASDRMDELGRGLSAWLSEPYSGAPFGRGRAENQLLALVRAGIENDFEQVVFPEYPELSDGKRALLRMGAKYASLSGSGSALYGLFASREAAARATAKLRKRGWTAQATVTLPRRPYWKRVVAG